MNIRFGLLYTDPETQNIYTVSEICSYRTDPEMVQIRYENKYQVLTTWVQIADLSSDINLDINLIRVWARTRLINAETSIYIVLSSTEDNPVGAYEQLATAERAVDVQCNQVRLGDSPKYTWWIELPKGAWERRPLASHGNLPTFTIRKTTMYSMAIDEVVENQ